MAKKPLVEVRIKMVISEAPMDMTYRAKDLKTAVAKICYDCLDGFGYQYDPTNSKYPEARELAKEFLELAEKDSRNDGIRCWKKAPAEMFLDYICQLVPDGNFMDEYEGVYFFQNVTTGETYVDIDLPEDFYPAEIQKIVTCGKRFDSEEGEIREDWE